MTIEQLEINIVVKRDTTEVYPELALKLDLRQACDNFLERTVTPSTDMLLLATRNLAIAQRVALSHYQTAVKIQKFVDNTIKHDTITLEDDIREFIKSFNKTTK